MFDSARSYSLQSIAGVDLPMQKDNTDTGSNIVAHAQKTEQYTG